MQHHGEHHLHMRRKHGHSPFPHPVKWKRRLDQFMFLLSVIAPLALLPQVYEVWVHQRVDGLSSLTFFCLSFIQIPWIVYGLAHRVLPVVLSSVVFGALHFSIALGVVLFS